MFLYFAFSFTFIVSLKACLSLSLSLCVCDKLINSALFCWIHFLFLFLDLLV
ncbi:hypothetical protein F4703DRAFT_1849685, partial [Phycomyces blakesleeanus]